MSSCVFCQRIANGDCADCGHDVVRFEPLNPVTLGHMLFVPRQHVANAVIKPWVTGFVFEEAAAHGRRQEWGFNLITSVGTDATQSVFHLHVHFVPRRQGDGLHLPWTGQVKP